MISVLYFHGFASSPASPKIATLRPLLRAHGIELDTPDLNVPSFERLDFDAVVAHAVECGRRVPPRALVGSSFGALVAIAVAKSGLALPLLLVAPAIGVANRWQETIPTGDPVTVFNHTRNENAPIHRAFFEQMANLHVDDEPPPSRVTAIMGRMDETVPFEMVETRWKMWEQSGRLVAGSKLIVIDDGDHDLLPQSGLIENVILEAVR